MKLNDLSLKIKIFSKRHDICDILRDIPSHSEVSVDAGVCEKYILCMLKAAGYRAGQKTGKYLISTSPDNWTRPNMRLRETCELLELLARIMVEENIVSRAFGIWDECNKTIYRMKCILFPEKLFAHQLDLMITQKCSLKCADCLNLMQYYKKPVNFEYKEIVDEIDALSQIFDEIEQLHILGGEPFMNQKIYEICQYAATKENIKWIVVFSNGTIVPNKKISYMNKKKTIFYLSNYQNEKQQLDLVEQTIVNQGLKCYRASFDGGWLSHSGFNLKSITAESMNTMFNGCGGRNCPTVLNGRIFYCEYLANATELHAIPFNDTNYVELHLDAKDEIKAYFSSKVAPLGCYYCDRPFKEKNCSHEMVPAGIQVKEPLPYKTYES